MTFDFSRKTMWFGNVPSNWPILPLRASLEERKKKNIGNKEKNILSVMKDVGVIRYEDKGNIGNKSSDRPEAYKVVYPGDIVANSMNLTIGSVGIAEEKGVTSSVYLVYFPKNENADARFFYYLFCTPSFQEHLALFGRGIMELRESVKSRDIKTQLVPTPPRETQQKIVAFLDAKTAAADAVIAKKKKLIALLKEKRASIITRAVTKGFDPNAKMKPSGIDWIGDIPEGWMIRKLKHLSKIRGGYAFDSSSYVDEDGGVLLVRISEVKDVLAGNDSKYVPNKMWKILVDFRVHKGDILVALTGYVGSASIFPLDVCAVLNQRVGKIVVNENALKKYIYYSIKNVNLKPFLSSRVKSSAQENVSESDIGEFVIALPLGRGEQQKIVAFLDEKTTQIDETIGKIERQIELLREYRASLVYHCVTGKFTVE